MTERLLRNGMQVRYKPVKNALGSIHNVTQNGFSVRFDEDGTSIPYEWHDENLFAMVHAPSAAITSHDAVAQALTVERLNRDRVEELLAHYREGLADDFENLRNESDTAKLFKPGLAVAVHMLRGET
jgi:hypothetical protein